MADKKVYRASTTAPVNIAVIKYWGKRDPALNLPTNSSLSVTLSQADLRTHTTASCSASFSQPDTLLLNSRPQSLSTPRSQACLSSLRALRAALEADDPTLPPLSTYPLRLVSTNNFPTAAGLASSAAGFAALVRAIADLYTLPHSPEELSLIARQGSGSACRSLLGGYVAWDAGARADGQDSCARLVAPRSHWPDLRALILVASAAQKDVSSTAGMQATVRTSGLFRARVETLVPERMAMMETAIQAREFPAFARITMRESNSFHATCLDTDPPIFYLNDVSRAAIQAVQAINEKAGRLLVAYTFDAGPNAVVYYEEKEREAVLGGFRDAVGGKEGWGETWGTGKGNGNEQEEPKNSTENGNEQARATGHEKRKADQDGHEPENKEKEEEKEKEKEEKPYIATLRNGITRIIHTSVGDGPVTVEEHLIDEEGNPKP